MQSKEQWASLPPLQQAHARTVAKSECNAPMGYRHASLSRFSGESNVPIIVRQGLCKLR